MLIVLPYYLLNILVRYLFTKTLSVLIIPKQYTINAIITTSIITAILSIIKELTHRYLLMMKHIPKDNKETLVIGHKTPVK